MLAVAIKMLQEENRDYTNDETVNVTELNNKLRCFSLQKKEFDSWAHNQELEMRATNQDEEQPTQGLQELDSPHESAEVPSEADPLLEDEEEDNQE